MKNVIVGAALVLTAAGCATSKLPQFGADMGKQSAMGQDIRPPYTQMVNYFGYVSPGGTPDAVIDNKKMYFLYLWIPAVAPEIGVRMVSPVADMAKPEKTDFVSPDFSAHADAKDYFDTWIRVERCLMAVNPEDITKPCSQWTKLEENDDSSELPAQPSGSKYNSVLRITSTPSDPMHALVRGMYRIAFTTYKPGDVTGTFLAQVGAPVALPGVAIAKTPQELSAAVAAAK